MNERNSERRRAWLIGAALAVLTFALYLPSLWHELLLYDDQQYVTENARVLAGLTWSGIKWAFGFHAGNWHPLAWLSHMLDCSIFGVRAYGHHLTNIILHTLNTVLLFLVLRSLTGLTWRCAVVAALFGWHPLHVESVAWVAERKDLLCAFFWILTMGAYARYAGKSGVQEGESRVQSPKSRVWYWVALGVFALALMCKPMAVTLPFVLLLLDFWPLGRAGERRAWRGLLLEKIPFLALTVIACVLTMKAQEPAIVSTVGLPVYARVAHAIVAYTHYFVAMFVPQNLAVYYPYETTISSGVVVAAALLLVAITGTVLRFSLRRPYWAVGWFWFLGTLVPVIGLVQVGDQAWADRYTYLPYVGLLMALVWVVGDAKHFFRNRVKGPLTPTLSPSDGERGKSRIVMVGTVAVLVLSMVLTTRQLSYWKNTQTLFTRAESATHNNLMAITMLGSFLAKEGKLDEAMERYRAALRINPRYPEAHFFLGHALEQQGKLDEAIAEYKQALWYAPVKEQTHVFLGAIYAKQNKFDEALSHNLEALKLNSDSSVTHNNLAKLFHTQGRLDEAIEHYHAALRLNPNLAQAHNNLGILLLQKGQVAEGATQLRDALRLNPGDRETEFNLACALNQQGQWQEATNLFSRTVTQNNQDPNAHYQFGLALSHQGETRGAMSELAIAILLKQDHADALDALAWILSTSAASEFRNGAEAVRMAETACDLTRRADPAKLKTLAAAYAEAGRFAEASETIRTAQQLAKASTRNELAKECEAMLASFNSSKPWRG